MDFELGEQHRMVAKAVRRFAEGEIAPVIRENDAEQRFDVRLIRRMGELGFLGISIPEAYGGAGLDYLTLAITCEELERVDTAFRTFMSVHLGLNSLTLLQWGTEEQKQKYLIPQAEGEKLACFGLTEPGSGSDAAALQTTATRDGDHYILNGQKTWITAADVFDHALIFASLDRAQRHRSLACFIVERAFPGVSSAPIHGKLGVRAGDTGQIFLQDVRVPAANLLGEPGEGFKIAMSAIDWGRYTVAAGAVGLIQACLDASVRYAHERQTFGQEIGRHQLIQQKIARMVANLEAARLLVYRCGWLKNQGLRTTRETSLAKWFATDAAFQAANDAVQVHGASGYSNAYPVERYLRNARGLQIYEGTSEIHELVQAEYALGYRQDKPLRCPPPPAPGWDRAEATGP